MTILAIASGVMVATVCAVLLLGYFEREEQRQSEREYRLRQLWRRGDERWTG